MRLALHVAESKLSVLTRQRLSMSQVLRRVRPAHRGWPVGSAGRQELEAERVMRFRVDPEHTGQLRNSVTVMRDDQVCTGEQVG